MTLLRILLIFKQHIRMPDVCYRLAMWLCSFHAGTSVGARADGISTGHSRKRQARCDS